MRERECVCVCFGMYESMYVVVCVHTVYIYLGV